MNSADINNNVSLRGFFTTQIYLQGQTLKEIENRLGFDNGRLSQGAWFVTTVKLPAPADFEFAGYSQVAGHHTKEQYGNFSAASMSDEYIEIKKSLIRQWQSGGSNRLVKVVPMIGHSLNMSDNYQYPPGSGIPQWKMVNPVLCRGICFVGNYPNGRFIPESGFTPVI